MRGTTHSIAVGNDDEAAVNARPGLWCVHGRPERGAFLPVDGEGVVIGRGDVSFAIADDKASRRHARVRMRGGLWFVDDLDSRNGTFVDGERLAAPWRGMPRVIRIGECLFVPVPDLGAAPVPLVEPDGTIAGPRLRTAWRRIDVAASTGASVHLHGETGSGKEIAARRFHRASPRPGGPFVAVNCATIPVEIAERILFGTRRGAYSGATADALGLVESAAGGTLFLDEVAELPLAVQAKLLRTLDAGEITPLGATVAKRIELSVVSASNARLDEAVTAQRFREDLFYRIVAHTIAIPPLRERPEEIVAHVSRILATIHGAPPPTTPFLEACVLRPWPGNVRELAAAMRHAVTEATVAEMNELRPSHLGPVAKDEPTAAMPDDSRITEALARHAGNVSACARELGIHRTQLRRWIARRDAG
jgi:transcriptional regulator of acetoin/glycerol metabolism